MNKNGIPWSCQQSVQQFALEVQKGWLSTLIIAGVLSTEQEHTMCWFSRKYKLASQKEAAISRLYIFVGLSSRSFKPKQRELLPGLVLYILISIYSILFHT